MYFRSFPTIDYDLKGNNVLYSLQNISLFADLKSKFIDDYSTYNYYQIKDGERPDLVSYKLYNDPKYYWTFMILNDNINNVWEDWPKSQYVLSRYITNYYGSKYVFTTDDDLVDIMTPGATVTGSYSVGAKATIVDKSVNLGYVEVEMTSTTLFASNRQEEETITDSNGSFISSTGFIPKNKAPHHYIDTDGNIVFKKASNYTEVTFEEYEIEQNNQNANIKVFKNTYISEVAKQFRRLTSNGTIYV